MPFSKWIDIKWDEWRLIEPLNLKAYIWAVVTSAAIAFGIRAFFIEAFKIPTPIMRPALEPGDTIFAIKYPYRVWRQSPRHGEVIIYQDPHGPEHYIKRVIAGPGDSVRMQKGRLVLNGKLLPYERESEGECGVEKHPKGEYRVCLSEPLYSFDEEVLLKPDEYFVAGDSRTVFHNKKASEVIHSWDVRATARWIWLSVVPPGAESAEHASRFRTERFFTAIR